MKALIAAALAAACFSFPAHAEKASIYTARFSDVAVGGHDPVAYFREGRPVVGAEAYSHQYDGATWRFASQENLDAFKAEPAKFAPQYGGYCAWAVANGYTAPGDPANWSVYEGKLYLNYNDKVQADWLKDPAGFIASANENWPGVLGE